MVDAGSIAQALQALTHATEIIKALRAADASFEKAELKLRIAELAEALATARMSVLEAQTEIQSLKDQIARTVQDARANIVKRENVYFIRNGETEAGPFCPRCFEVEGLRMPVTALTGAFRHVAKYMCPKCQASY